MNIGQETELYQSQHPRFPPTLETLNQVFPYGQASEGTILHRQIYKFKILTQ